MTAFSGPDRDQLRQQLADVLRAAAAPSLVCDDDTPVHLCRACTAAIQVTCSVGDVIEDIEGSVEAMAAALLPVLEAHTRAARADGAAQALQDAAHVLSTDSDEAIEVALGGVSYAARFLRTRAEALRTHEGDTNEPR